MSVPEVDLVRNLRTMRIEELLSNVARLRDLVAGCSALLTGAPSPQAIHTARATAMEARALAHLTIDALERDVAIEHEARRYEHNQAGKHIHNGEVR